MKPAFDFHPSVHVDIEDAYQWYERQRNGLGTDFLGSVELALDKIRDYPTRHGFVQDDVREGVLTRFPRVSCYRILSGSIRVLAVHHPARHPSTWQFRN